MNYVTYHTILHLDGTVDVSQMFSCSFDLLIETIYFLFSYCYR